MAEIQSNNKLNRTYLTFEEASEYLGVKRTQMYDRLKKGLIAYHQAGAKRMFLQSDLDEYIAWTRVTPFRATKKGSKRRR